MSLKEQVNYSGTTIFIKEQVLNPKISFCIGTIRLFWNKFWVFQNTSRYYETSYLFRNKPTCSVIALLYITSILLIIIAITCDKIWNVLHFDRRDPRGALILAFLCIVFYLTSVFTVGFTKRPNNEWQNFPLMTILIINTLWFVYQFYIDSIYQTYYGLGMTRYEASHNKNIK